VERLCLSFAIAPGSGEEFDRRHHEAWPEFLEALGRSGFRNYTLFRRGEEVIAYGECEPTVDEAFAKLSAEPVAARWSAWFVPEIMSAPAAEAAGIPDRVGEIWHFAP